MRNSAKRLQKGRNFFSSSIRNRIIIPYALLTLIIAGFGIFVVTYLVAGSFEERFRNQLLDAGRVVADEVVDREELRLEVERTIANTLGVAQALIDQEVNVLNMLILPVVYNDEFVDSAILLDAQGRQVIAFHRELGDPEVLVDTGSAGSLDYFVVPAVAAVLADPEGDRKEVTLLRNPQLNNELMVYTIGPVKTETGTVGAVLVGTYLEKEIDVLRSVALADITLFNPQGEVIASTLVPDLSLAAQVFESFTSERYQEIVDQAEEVVFLDEVEEPGQEVSGDVQAGGQNYRHAYAPFNLRGQQFGVYGVGLPTNFITEANNQTRIFLSLIFAGGVVAVLVIGYSISQRIIRPIIRLMHTSQDIAGGNLDRRTGIESNDEIGVLANAFDDMTEKLQEKTIALREEASKLNAILNSIADGVIVQDLQGNIITSNPAAERILAEIDEDIESTQAPEVEETTDDVESAQALNRLTGLEFQKTDHFEVGNQILSGLSAPVVTSDGEKIGSVVVLRDITREVEADKLKDNFITSMSHEMRTPPTAIKGYVDLLKMTAAGKLDERQLGFVEAIDRNVQDLLNIIQQMLDLSQIDAGTLGIDQELQNFTELLETEIETWRPKMAERELSFETRLLDKPVWVRGDSTRLSTVISNLLSNAHNYTLPGGRVELLMSHGDDKVRIDVKDTGVGISEEDQRFLFTRFFRAIHEESTFEISGAGLGLYMSEAIIKAHRGEITFESKFNEGSMFSIILPTVEYDPTLIDEAKEEMMQDAV